MSTTDIPIDNAELIAVILEALLYGFSLLMFGATIWTLLSGRPACQVNRKMLVAACLLLLGSTTHLGIHFLRVVQGLILYRDTYPGGPVAYFSIASQWTFLAQNLVYLVQATMGDAVILYRCYMIWDSKLIMVVPVLLWLTAVVTATVSSYIASRARQDEVFSGALLPWIVGFWTSELGANLLTTLLIVFRIWYANCSISGPGIRRRSMLCRVQRILTDAGAIYTITLCLGLLCFLCKTNIQYIILDLATPIISITFYMVIIRIGLAARASVMTDNMTELAFQNVFTDGPSSGMGPRQSGLRIHVATLTENKVDHVPCPSTRIAIFRNGNRTESSLALEEPDSLKPCIHPSESADSPV